MGRIIMLALALRVLRYGKKGLGIRELLCACIKKKSELLIDYVRVHNVRFAYLVPRARMGNISRALARYIRDGPRETRSL